MRDKVRYMIEPLSHRGPDGSGVWHDEENGVAIGHTRLSVLDVSKAGVNQWCRHQVGTSLLLMGKYTII